MKHISCEIKILRVNYRLRFLILHSREFDTSERNFDWQTFIKMSDFVKFSDGPLHVDSKSRMMSVSFLNSHRYIFFKFEWLGRIFLGLKYSTVYGWNWTILKKSFGTNTFSSEYWHAVNSFARKSINIDTLTIMYSSTNTNFDWLFWD